MLADALGLGDEVRSLFMEAARGRADSATLLAVSHVVRRGSSTAATRTLPRSIASFIGREPELRKVVIAMLSALSFELSLSPTECTTGPWYTPGVDVMQAVDRITELLESGTGQTSNTSMRIPTELRDAAAVAVRELGAASSTTALTTAALRASLEAVVMRALLDDHFRQYPEARPNLGDLAIAAAELDGHPLAGEPARIRQAAVEVAVRHPEAEPEDVLLWAEARAISAP